LLDSGRAFLQLLVRFNVVYVRFLSTPIECKVAGDGSARGAITASPVYGNF